MLETKETIDLLFQFLDDAAHTQYHAKRDLKIPLPLQGGDRMHMVEPSRSNESVLQYRDDKKNQGCTIRCRPAFTFFI